MAELVLLTGVSGFIAKHCAVALLNAGYAVRGSVRRLDRADEVRAAVAPQLTDPALLARLSFVALDLESDAGWAEAMTGVSALMHTASPFPIAQPKNETELIRPAVEGTRRALEAAHASGVHRVVLTSSVAAVMHAGPDRLLDETDWCDVNAAETSAYSKSKTLAEKTAWELSRKLGLALTTINPAFVLGPPLDGNFGSSVGVVKRLLKGKDPMLPDLTFSVVDVRDVAEMHLRALQRPDTAGKRFIASSGTLSMVEMGRALKSSNPVRRIPTRQAPGFLLRIMAIWDDQIRAILPSLGRVEKLSNRRATNDMGMQFASPKEALLASADWLIGNGHAWKAPVQAA